MPTETKKTGSLVIVGTGIKFLSHLTTEAKANIQHADKVLYLVNDPLLKAWISQQHANTESLDALYQQFTSRENNYTAITEHIVNTAATGIHLCVVFYGHPAVFSKPGLNAVRLARQQGLQAVLLPAISAEDCLFADLLIDPGSDGCQSFEASDLLIYQRQINTSSHVIIWQIGVIGARGQANQHNNATGIQLLVDYLQKRYPPQHTIILYEAAQYPGFKPIIQTTTLNNLEKTQLSSLTTLYIPPAEKKEINAAMLQQLLSVNPTECSHNPAQKVHPEQN